MNIHRYRKSMLLALVLAAALLNGTVCTAEEDGMRGWGMNDPYNKHYDVTKYEKIRAWVVGFKAEPPMPGMSPGTIMVVKTGTQLIDVHICPTWFAKPGDIGVKKGDRVKIKGCRAEIDQKEVFMAAKVKKGNYFEFKVRLTKSGKPFWTLTPEELAGERLPENIQ
jgi:hypothetical protein